MCDMSCVFIQYNTCDTLFVCQDGDFSVGMHAATSTRMQQPVYAFNSTKTRCSKRLMLALNNSSFEFDSIEAAEMYIIEEQATGVDYAASARLVVS